MDEEEKEAIYWTERQHAHQFTRSGGGVGVAPEWEPQRMVLLTALDVSTRAYILHRRTKARRKILSYPQLVGEWRDIHNCFYIPSLEPFLV